MFEKEAEEYIKEHTFFDEEFGAPSLDVGSKTIFKDGAEFGYNKANEWHEIESKVTPNREISKQYMPKNKEKVLLKYHFSGDEEIHISDGYYDAYDIPDDIKRECKTCKNPYCSRTLEERQKKEVQVHTQYGWECCDKEKYLQNDGGYVLVKKEESE